MTETIHMDKKAAEHLHGALHQIGKLAPGSAPTAEQISGITSSIKSAVDLLLHPERDPLKRRLAFIACGIQESTLVEEKNIRGRILTTVTITNREIYNAVISAAHKLPKL